MLLLYVLCGLLYSYSYVIIFNAEGIADGFMRPTHNEIYSLKRPFPFLRLRASKLPLSGLRSPASRRSHAVSRYRLRWRYRGRRRSGGDPVFLLHSGSTARVKSRRAGIGPGVQVLLFDWLHITNCLTKGTPIGSVQVNVNLFAPSCLHDSSRQVYVCG